MNWPIVIDDLPHMCVEGLLSHLRVPGQLNILSEAPLLPENGNTPSELGVTDQELVIDHYDLLCLTSICNVTLVINTSGIVPGTCSHVHSSRDQCHCDGSISQGSRHLPKVTLHQRRKP